MSNAVSHPWRCIAPGAVRALGWLFAATLLFQAFGGRAEGSCGDWLASHGRAEPTAHVGFRADDAPSTADGDRRIDTRLPAVPVCDGPTCRGIPPLPVLPWDGAVPEIVLDHAVLAAVDAALPSPVDGFVRSRAVDVPVAPVGSVPTPPPRAVALPA